MLYFGIIDRVIPPDSPESRSKNQYEYDCILTTEGMASQIYKCIRMDTFGSFNDYDDKILQPGWNVLVLFPLEDPTVGFIIGGARKHPSAQKSSEGTFQRQRFNEVEQEVDKAGAFHLRSRNQVDGAIGPNLHVTKQKVRLGDEESSTAEDYIEIDKNSKTITIKSKEWDVNITNAANIIIGGNAKVEVKGKADVKVTGPANIDAATINLNGNTGGVLTTATQPTCYVTGIPFIGSTRVKAGN